MRKLVSLVLTAAFAVSSCLSLAGCSNKPAETTAAATTKTGETAQESKPNESTPASGSIKVGAIYINSQNDTAGYTYAHHKGITDGMKQLGS